jgi:N-acetylneuraminic acid mutarotase
MRTIGWRLSGPTLVGLLALALFGVGAAPGTGPETRGVTSSKPAAARFDRWIALKPSTLARDEVAGARVGRFVYIVGGFTEPIGGMTSVLERYDIRRNRWRRMRPMPVALNHPVAVAYSGKLYVHGGWRGLFSDPSSDLFRFNPRTNRWKRLRPSPRPRVAHAAAVIGHRLYVAGGANDGGSLRSLDVYNFRRNRWRRGRSLSGPARNHTRGVAAGGFFYVLAGRKGGPALADPPPLRSYAAVDRYNPRSHRWRRMPAMRGARSGFGAVRLGDGRIVVFGGDDFPVIRLIKSAELFDPRTRRWSRLPSMRTPRGGGAEAALGNRVYALEGTDKPAAAGPSAVVEALDVRAAPRR